MNEKYTVMSPFDVTHKMLGPYLFSATSRDTLGDKMELYFHDPSFMPLFIQVMVLFLLLCLYSSHSHLGELPKDCSGSAEERGWARKDNEAPGVDG